MRTEDIIQGEIDSFADAFYGYLIKDSDKGILPETLQELLKGISASDASFILDGLEEKYFADYTYFRSEQYGEELFAAIPYGEIEVPAGLIEEDEANDWTISGEYAYQDLPAVTFVYNIEKVRRAIQEWTA